MPPGASTLDDAGLPLPASNQRAVRLGLAVVGLGLVSGLATYLILTGLTPITPRAEVVLAVLVVNGAMIVAMIALIAWQVHGLMRAWRERVPGARLHVRIVALFSIIAALPAILLAVAATITFSRSLDNWFSARTRQIVSSSLEVAQAYLDEHGQVIRTEIVSMARDIDSAAATVQGDDRQFRSLLLVQAGLRNLPAAFVINRDATPRVSAIMDDKITYAAPPPGVIQQASVGQVVLMTSPTTSRIAAVTRLEKIPGALLYVVRGVSPQVVSYVGQAQAGVDEYEQLRRRRGGLRFAHGLMYFAISTTALLAAIWVGLWFASRFVAPIRRLIFAATEVSKGNLAVELPIRKGEGDLRRLSQTFNTMTSELKSQRDELVSANDQLLERRLFMEAVLSGVSAGVLGVDGDGTITLANRSAERLLGRGEGELAGRTLADAMPELVAAADASEEAAGKARRQRQVNVAVNGEERTFAVRVTQAEAATGGHGTVVTFDDITELVSAQRTAAWADVARRIAHEIKNPLTPIQLSAERIRRKYDKVITEDREVFDKCTETIIRQVGDVARMVDEFSSFARMPKPQMEDFDLRVAVRDSVTLFQMGTRDVAFTLDMPKEPLVMSIDRRLITQAVTNLVKNAAEACQQHAEGPDREEGYKGRVETIVARRGEEAVIEVIDNGVGLARQNRARLLEPYVTTKAKGTGLGLAIVQKVVEQHGGTLVLEDAPPGEGRTRGALVRITMPVRRGEAATQDRKADAAA